MPFYGGSALGGLAEGLNDVSARNIQRQQAAEMEWRLSQQKAAQSAMGPAGNALYGWANQPTQQPPAPPSGPPSGTQMSAPPSQNSPAIQPWKAPQPASTPGQAFGAPPAPPGNQVGQDGQGGSPGITVAQSPFGMQMLRLMQQNGVPPDQVVSVMERVSPIWGKEVDAIFQNKKIAQEDLRQRLDQAKYEHTVEKDAAQLDEKAREHRAGEEDKDQKRAEMKRWHQDQSARSSRQTDINEKRAKAYADRAAKDKSLANNTTYQVANTELKAARENRIAIINSFSRFPNPDQATILAFQQSERAADSAVAAADARLRSVSEEIAAQYGGKVDAKPSDKSKAIEQNSGLIESMQDDKPVAAPAVGTVIDGFRFKGGDPNKESSWAPVRKK